MERKKILVILILCLIFSFSFVTAEENWVLEKDKNDIKCYTRVVKGSVFKEYKAVVTVDSTYSGLLALFDDVKNYPQWMELCIKGEVLKRKTPFEYYSYTINDPPWPITNREAVVLNKTVQNPKTGYITVKFRSVKGMKRDPDLIRVDLVDGYWKLMKKGKKVEVVYKVHSEPGGSLPSGLVNAFIISQPYNTLLNLKKEVQKDKYQGITYENIKE